MIRVYHFTAACWALDDIKRRRIKIAEYHNCNDPFELGCYVGGNRERRLVLRLFKNDIRKAFGFVSFSHNWHNALLWSHYADCHKGMCLGFDLKDGLAQPVRYAKTRPFLPPQTTQNTATTLLLTKAHAWAYEEEWRVSASLNDRDPETGLCFYLFSDELRLREVIVGAHADESISERTVKDAVGDYRHRVAVRKARLGFSRFEVVTQRWGFSNPIERYPSSLASKYSKDVLTAAVEAGYSPPRNRASE